MKRLDPRLPLYKAQRAMDLLILWPACRKQASDLYAAQAAFAVHAFQDPAWKCLGEDEIRRRIGKLR